jgi:hypothetical protein
MRSACTRRRHPLVAAGSAVEHVVLRHFGLHVTRDATKDSPPRILIHPGRPPSRSHESPRPCHRQLRCRAAGSDRVDEGDAKPDGRSLTLNGTPVRGAV